MPLLPSANDTSLIESDGVASSSLIVNTAAAGVGNALVGAEDVHVPPAGRLPEHVAQAGDGEDLSGETNDAADSRQPPLLS